MSGDRPLPVLVNSKVNFPLTAFARRPVTWLLRLILRITSLKESLAFNLIFTPPSSKTKSLAMYFSPDFSFGTGALKTYCSKL